MQAKKSRTPEWEKNAEFESFRGFLKVLGREVEQTRLKRKGKVKRAAKNARTITPFTLEFMDTSPNRVDVKYFQGLIAGKKNFTMLTLYLICKKLRVQPQSLFKDIVLEFED